MQVERAVIEAVEQEREYSVIGFVDGQIVRRVDRNGSYFWVAY